MKIYNSVTVYIVATGNACVSKVVVGLIFSPVPIKPSVIDYLLEY